MAFQKDRLSVYQGRFHRTIGKVVNDRGKVVPKKFLLGTDKGAAEVANRLLETLWTEVVAEYQREKPWLIGQGSVTRVDEAWVPQAERDRLRALDPGPVWRAQTLRIAEAVRKGIRQVTVEVEGLACGNPFIYASEIALLRRKFSVIAFVPASPQQYALGLHSLKTEAKNLVSEAQELSDAAQTPLATATGQTLYQALDAYGRFALGNNPKEYDEHEAAATHRLKDAHPDVPLERFGISSLERIAAYWAGRPKSRKSGEPVALSTITNQLKTARRFIRWLHRSSDFRWTKPVDADDALRVRVERLRTDDEVARLGNGVKVWTVDELTVLYRHALDQERVYILLGLNCGFAQSEVCTLRHDEIRRQEQPPAIKRIRRKSMVPGVFALWPETLKALDWCRSRTPRPDNGNDTYVLLTKMGELFVRQRLSNAWNALLRRVGEADAKVKKLSFKYLRKTAGQLVRDRSDGEICGVFLCHGKAVKTDDQADLYSNRPFDKVTAALQQVRKDLQPMFDATPDAFAVGRSRAPKAGGRRAPAALQGSATG